MVVAHKALLLALVRLLDSVWPMLPQPPSDIPSYPPLLLRACLCLPLPCLPAVRRLCEDQGPPERAHRGWRQQGGHWGDCPLLASAAATLWRLCCPLLMLMLSDTRANAATRANSKFLSLPSCLPQSQGLQEERRSPMPPRIYSDAG